MMILEMLIFAFSRGNWYHFGKCSLLKPEEWRLILAYVECKMIFKILFSLKSKMMKEVNQWSTKVFQCSMAKEGRWVFTLSLKDLLNVHIIVGGCDRTANRRDKGSWTHKLRKERGRQLLNSKESRQIIMKIYWWQSAICKKNEQRAGSEGPKVLGPFSWSNMVTSPCLPGTVILE